MTRQKIFERFPELKSKWDYNLNKINPQETYLTLDKYWWKCDNKNHSFYNTIYRAKDNSCGVCHGKQIVIGINDYASQVKPEILKEWDYTKNNFLPTEITLGSNKTVWWKCSKNHSWSAEAGRRSKRGDSCPYCNRKTLAKGINDLKTYCLNNKNLTHLIIEWHPENGKIESYTCRAGKKVKWICRANKKHIWDALISNRTAGDGCPYCRTSEMENQLYYWLKTKTNLNITKNDKTIIKPKEIDILIKEIKIGIEFNGDYWHSSKFLGYSATEHHLKKKKLCEKQGYKLAFVWESDWKNHRAEIETALILLINTGEQSPILTKLEGILDAP